AGGRVAARPGTAKVARPGGDRRRDADERAGTADAVRRAAPAYAPGPVRGRLVAGWAAGRPAGRRAGPGGRARTRPPRPAPRAARPDRRPRGPPPPPPTRGA